LPHPGAVAVTSVGGVGIRRRAPRLGEHNAEVYAAVGIDAATQAELQSLGII
jgi:crotonobetainyl-CoA:carnitine CoA-transferase CaiB-like acyl-CoA transferase